MVYHYKFCKCVRQSFANEDKKVKADLMEIISRGLYGKTMQKYYITLIKESNIAARGGYLIICINEI